MSLFTGCGFHLRRPVCDIQAQYPAVICPLSGTHTFHQALYNAFLNQGITVIECPTDECLPKIQVISQSLDTQPLVYGTDGELRRERLRMTVVFSIHTDCTRHISLATYRDRQLNSRQHLGDNAEKILLEREMQQDIIQQLFRSLIA